MWVPAFSDRFCSVVALLICCIASTFLLSVASFTCGAPLALCGRSIPAGTTCPKGAGWCTAGHYCGYTNSSKVQCVPLPKNCGKAGNVCCPSNTRTPHTNSTPPLQRMPFCKVSVCNACSRTYGIQSGASASGLETKCNLHTAV
jgi:hypothetical protein